MSIPWKKVAAAAVVAALALGLLGVFDALNSLIAMGVAVVVALLVWPSSWPRADLILVRLLGAVLIALLVLAGVNVFTNLLGLGHLPILLGLFVAVVVFGCAAFWYLRRSGWARGAAIATAAALAIGVIVVAPYLFGKLSDNPSEVPASEKVRSQLDVLIVGDGSRHPQPPQLPPNPAASEFDVHYSVGFAEGERVRWALVDDADPEATLRALARGDSAPPVTEPPVARPEADTALLLLVDGTAPVTEDPAALPDLQGAAGEVTRWRHIAAGAAPAGTPAFALLQTTQRPRLRRWRRFASPGGAVSVQELASPAVTDAAVRLAIEAPTAQADFALAMAYRPILLFDHSEAVPWPLSVNALFNEGRVTLCRDQGVAQTECGSEPLKRPAELESGGTHLRLETKDPAELRRLARSELAAQEREAEAEQSEAEPRGAGSTLYVRPVSVARNERDFLYLDYWWYLPENPVGVGGGALCGAGFVIPGVTCQNHQSDWEGITVVIDRSAAEPRPVAVQYAQHDSVVRYGWGQLRERWDVDQRVQNLVAGIADAATRPLAFAASGTHATYPLPCRRHCHQVAHRDLGEGPHRGDLGWVGNDTAACGRSSCLQMLPTRAGGEEPALWNAYDGPWGERHCFLTYYCDSGSPPTAPGHQERYEHPSRYDGYVDKQWRFRRAPFED